MSWPKASSLRLVQASNWTAQALWGGLQESDNSTIMLSPPSAVNLHPNRCSHSQGSYSSRSCFLWRCCSPTVQDWSWALLFRRRPASGASDAGLQTWLSIAWQGLASSEQRVALSDEAAPESCLDAWSDKNKDKNKKQCMRELCPSCTTTKWLLDFERHRSRQLARYCHNNE